jgi:hypothetical protein
MLPVTRMLPAALVLVARFVYKLCLPATAQ